MAAYESTTEIVLVYANSVSELYGIAADLRAIKHAFIMPTGDEYILPPGGVWTQLHNQVE